MKFWQWVASEKKETDRTDWCSNFPDVFLGFNLYQPCKLHDFFNRGVRIPGRQEPAGFIELQFVFWKAIIRQVNRDAINIPHLLLGYLLSFLIWLATSLTFPIWYKHNL